MDIEKLLRDAKECIDMASYPEGPKGQTEAALIGIGYALVVVAERLKKIGEIAEILDNARFSN